MIKNSLNSNIMILKIDNMKQMSINSNYFYFILLIEEINNIYNLKL